jgi:hypothetical protein
MTSQSERSVLHYLRRRKSTINDAHVVITDSVVETVAKRQQPQFVNTRGDDAQAFLQEP